jgi:hypothetical protein
MDIEIRSYGDIIITAKGIAALRFSAETGNQIAAKAYRAAEVSNGGSHFISSRRAKEYGIDGSKLPTMAEIAAQAESILSSGKAVPAKAQGHDPVSLKSYPAGQAIIVLASGKYTPETVLKAIASWK